jgi:hypothetical protein
MADEYIAGAAREQNDPIYSCFPFTSIGRRLLLALVLATTARAAFAVLCLGKRFVGEGMRRTSNRTIQALLLTILCCSILSAAPSITAVANAASSIGFNSPIAQGSIFVIYGTDLGPAAISIS